MSKTQYCLVDPSGGSIKVQITANNGVRTGSLFVLWEIQNEEWQQKETFQMITGDQGLDEFILLEKPQDIENDSLAWSINTCSLIRNVERAEFSVSIFQDEKMLWKKQSSRLVPKCEEGRQLNFGSHVIFKHKIAEPLENQALWKENQS